MKNFAFAMAVMTAMLLVVMVIAGGAAYPGYSHVSQYISELGAVDAPHAFAVNWFGFLPIGIGMCLFALSAMLALPKTPSAIIGFAGLLLYATGYVISPFFPCDAGCRPADEPSAAQFIHNAGAIVSYLSGAIGLLVLSTAAKSWPEAKWLGRFALIAGVLCLVSFAMLGPTNPFVGLFQRLTETLTAGWMLACGFYLRGQNKKTP